MIRGEKRAMDKHPSVNVKLNASIHNRFDIEVVDAKSGKVKQRAFAYNVICDNLWNTLFNITGSDIVNFFQYIQYGTGNGTPSASDISLFSYLDGGSVTYGTERYDALTGLYSATKSIQISESQHVGAVITEIGIASSSASSGKLCTHAMLEDMNGNKISILKSDTDIINMYATVFLHLDPTKKNGSQILPIIQYKDSHFAHIASVFTGNMFSSTDVGRVRLFSTPNVYVTSDILLGTPVTTGDVSSKTITFGPIRAGANVGNIGGLFGVGFSFTTNYNTSKYYVPFIALFAGEGWFPGSNVTAEAVGTGDGITTEFSLKFPYATNGKIYLDGVEVTGATVRKTPTKNDSMYILQLIDARSTADNIIPFISDSLSTMSTYANRPGRNLYDTSGAYFYNPLWEVGIDRFNFNKASQVEFIEFSDDMENWIKMDIIDSGLSDADYYVPDSLKHKKFFRLKTITSTAVSKDANGIYFPEDMPIKAVLFDTPPEEGAVITADYHTPVIAKDENHVFDVSLSITFNEYSTGT